ncbi:Ig-like domain-containing protein [Maribacter sp. X9]|uniref:Ig-like domain-containing protein n=1 Tax=Maribacter sp. X9 TaxID=3402159 RepID=UPI003AF397D3
MGEITFIDSRNFNSGKSGLLFSCILFLLVSSRIFGFEDFTEHSSNLADTNYYNGDLDDDDDGILNTVEDQNEDGDNNYLTNPSDQDRDGIPNYLDIDSDNDGILDTVEAQTSIGFISKSGIDANNNGVDDAFEGAWGIGLTPINTDLSLGGRGRIPDYLDVDSDIDGIRDNVEAQSFFSFVPPSNIDANGNGLDDAYEGSYGFGIVPINSDDDQYPDFRDFDSDADGIKDKVEAQTTQGYIAPIGDNNKNDIDDAYEDGLSTLDTDGDSIPDYRDLDSDNDGILDNRESQTINEYKSPSGVDNNNNGLDDVYTYNGITPINSDSDTQPDFRDIDSDNDGIPDNVEVQTTAGYIAPNLDDEATYAFNDGVNSAYPTGLTPVNTDGNDSVDYLDDDSDDDLVPDNNEGNDFNFDGIPDQTLTGIDTDGDGLDDGYEGSDVNDGYDVNDEINDPTNDLPDTDGTEDVNYRDIDDDGDGLNTPDEDANHDGDPTNDDTDNDGTPDYLDPDNGNNENLDVVDDTASTPKDTAVEIDILDNDSGIPSDGTLTVAEPTSGTVDINDGGTPDDITDDTVIYTPKDGYEGTDSFEYTVCDAMDACDTATITVIVGTPVALDVVDDTASTPKDTAVEIDILDNDSGIPSDGTLTVAEPTSGTVDINHGGTPADITDDTVTYTPKDGYEGTDSFEYTVCDAMGTCDTATITVTVGTPVDLDVVDDTASTPKDTAVEIDVLDNDLGIPSDGTLTVAEPTSGTVDINDGGTPADITDDTVTYTPKDGYEGTDSFEYTVCDAVGTCDTATITVTVGTPVALDVVDDTASTPMDTAVEIDVLDNDFGIPQNGTLTTTEPSNGRIETNDGGTPDDITDDTVIYTPKDGYDGTDKLFYTVCDADGNCDTAMINILITVIEVNQMVTPNGDGKNDFLFIKGVDKIRSSTLKIFNRWGVAVYEGENYNNQNNVFDGRSRGRSTLVVEDYLPAGVYFYIFDYTTLDGVNKVDSEYLYISR